MSISKDIIKDLKLELESKIRQRATILDQLQLLDIEIDKYDTLITNIDSEVLKYTSPINDAANKVKEVYDARIQAGCRSDLVWSQVNSGRYFSAGSLYNFITYRVIKNPATESFKPYDGVKYYQKPSNRDYGSTLIAEFNGGIFQGSSIIAINVPDQSVIDITSSIKIGDTIVDDTDSPRIFSLGELPEVIGFGTTETVGIVTTLVGGVISGVSTFFKFEAGILDDVEPGMKLIQPNIYSETGELESYIDVDTTIVGIDTGVYPIQYYDEDGSLATAFVDCDVLILDKPALKDLEEAQFTVGIVTTLPAIFISTTANQTILDSPFQVIRSTDIENIDINFDPFSNPNSPLKIGAIDSNTVGSGSSAYYDFSGQPSTTQSWRPETARNEVKIKNDVIVSEIKEPNVGIGSASYNIGTLQWPIKYSLLNVFTGISIVEYAPLGTEVRAIEGSLTIGYASQPQGGFPSNCNQLDSNITQAESLYSQQVSQNRSSAQQIAGQSSALRTERDRKELLAFSLLQASSTLRSDIQRLRTTLSQLDGIDFTPYES